MHTIEKRRAVRTSKKNKDKELLRNERELDGLYKRKWETPWIKLDKPIQNGYVRNLVLRDDISRRKDADVFERIRKTLNKPMYCRNADFKVRKRKSGQYEEIEHHIFPIGEGRWEKLEWPEHFKKYFTYGTKYYTHPGGYTSSFTGYWFNTDWMFDYKIEPHYLTHYQPIDPDLESQIKVLEKKVWDDDKNRGRLTKLHGWPGRMSDDWCRADAWTRAMHRIMAAQIREWQENHYDGTNNWND